MKLINAMQKPDLPGMLLFQPAGVLNLPHSVEVSDALAVNGSGVGGGSSSIKAALGEYFERRHFYREILSKSCGCLSESLTDHEVRSFAEAFVQTTSTAVSVGEVEKYRFTLSEVVRISDFSKCFIPTVCISLSSHGLGSDSLLYPLRDTCGCSFHWCSEVAFLGAIKEYLERQFLVRFWLTKKCRSQIPFALVTKLLLKRNVRHLYTALITSGEITFLDISDTRFPGVCVLAVYGQRKVNRHVRYCAGMSFAPNLACALEKSLLELWQTFRFMDLFKSISADERKLEDSYIRYFLSCNTYKTYQEITDVLVSIEGRDVRSQLKFTVSGFLSVLKAQGIFGYFYSRREKINGVDCVFSKFVSPDLFLHMNNSRNFNLRNKYSSAFESSILPSRLEEMVPFP